MKFSKMVEPSIPKQVTKPTNHHQQSNLTSKPRPRPTNASPSMASSSSPYKTTRSHPSYPSNNVRTIDLIDPNHLNDASSTIYSLQQSIDTMLQDIQQSEQTKARGNQLSTTPKEDERRGAAIQRIADAISHLTW